LLFLGRKDGAVFLFAGRRCLRMRKRQRCSASFVMAGRSA
jgi:hypothetical protein